MDVHRAVERDPPRFAALVSADYAGALRASALAEAARDRKGDPRGMRLWADGGESFYFCGPHRATLPALRRLLVEKG